MADDPTFPSLARFNALLDGIGHQLTPAQRLIADALLARRKASGKTYLITMLALSDPHFAESYAIAQAAIRASRPDLLVHNPVDGESPDEEEHPETRAP